MKLGDIIIMDTYDASQFFLCNKYDNELSYTLSPFHIVNGGEFDTWLPDWIKDKCSIY